MLIGIFIFLYKKKIDEHHLNKRNFFLDIANLWLAGKEKVTNFISLTSQGFFGLAFWICLHSVGIEINIFLILFVTPGIFLIGSLPIAIAGFGPREAGSILFLLPFSVNNENIFVSSILFGLASTIIGAITLLINLLLQSKKR